jgi:tRNA-2-methylthio-N6-dimethylallyladenosine synthase
MWLISNLVAFRGILDTGKISYISTPIQSGNDRILSLMNRTYNVEGIKHAIETINTNYPLVNLHTQIMVGFPDETTDDFYDTFNLLKKLRFKEVEVYNFSPRQGTLAAKMPNQVPFKISLKRAYEICSTFDYALRMG